MPSRLTRSQRATPHSLEEVSDVGDIIEIDGDYYIYTGNGELIDINHYGREEARDT